MARAHEKLYVRYLNRDFTTMRVVQLDRVVRRCESCGEYGFLEHKWQRPETRKWAWICRWCLKFMH